MPPPIPPRSIALVGQWTFKRGVPIIRDRPQELKVPTWGTLGAEYEKVPWTHFRVMGATLFPTVGSQAPEITFWAVLVDFPKIAQNHPKLAQKHFGGPQTPYRACFGPIEPTKTLENPYSSHLEGPISRDLGGFGRFPQNSPKSPQVGPETLWRPPDALSGPFWAQRTPQSP